MRIPGGVVKAPLGFAKKGSWKTHVSYVDINLKYPRNTDRMGVPILNPYLADRQTEVGPVQGRCLAKGKGRLSWGHRVQQRRLCTAQLQECRQGDRVSPSHTAGLPG